MHRPGVVSTDVNLLFARAEQAFAAGRLDAARADLETVQRSVGDNPTVLHLRALVEKKRGDSAAARRAFERASALAPGDARLAANHANLLSELGEADAALRLYDRALALQPGFRNAHYNRALLLHRLGRLEEALADVDAIPPAKRDARVHSERGALLRELGRLAHAAAAYDRALAIDPGRMTALRGRARVAMERGEAGASAFYIRGLRQAPGDPELVLGLAEAMEADGDPTGLQILKDAVERTPEWLAGHETLARMRSETGEGDAFADHYLKAIKHRPRDRALHYSHWQSLARGEKHGEALVALQAARGSIDDDPDMLLMEAIFTSEAGDPHGALALLDRSAILGSHPGLDFARGRISLRAGDCAAAAALFETVTRSDPMSVNGWAHLDLCWRLLGDARHHWLSGQQGLYAARDVGLDQAELAQLAELLRSLHKTRAHPIGQSLRGGTQTRGRLFSRSEPGIRRLHDAIVAAVRTHFAELPAFDASHPLLRHRDAPMRIEGSWSVRLTSHGFHVSHIHPEGVLSSACYISLPDSLGGGETRAGWLELGRPPVELGLALDPLAVIEPRLGRLALFPSYLFHGTRPFDSGERLTVAFDIVL